MTTTTAELPKAGGRASRRTGSDTPDFFRPDQLVVPHDHPSLGATKGVSLGFGTLLTLRHGLDGSQQIQLRYSPGRRDDPEQINSAIDACMCRARARGNSASIDVGVIEGEPTAALGVCLIRALSQSAKSVGLDLTFDNVPSRVLDKFNLLGFSKVPNEKITVGSTIPESSEAA